MRVIHKVEEGQYKALVRGRNMYLEYEVDFYISGAVQAPARYYTDDRGDAESTADAWVASKVAGGVVAGVVGAGDAAAAG